MKKIITIHFLTLLCFQVVAQKSTENGKVLSNQETKEVLRQVSSKIDTTKFLHSTGEEACKCIDSISLKNKGRDETIVEINKCINKQAIVYQSLMKVYNSMGSADPSNDKIIVDASEKSAEYKKYYYQLEQWLKDSCNALNRAIRSDNKQSENSISLNKDARKAYSDGETYFSKDDYANALPYFEKAVQIDPKFAFAWDNIGVCNRKLGKLDKALEAYQKSLALDPTGRTPLQNIPVVYVYKKEYDKAIDAYKQLLAVSPSDPEVYYGIGNIYYNNKNDMEKALDNMCKAYNIYTEQKSPYRVDAQKVIGMIYAKLKADNKEDTFYKILKDNNISVNK